MTSTACALMSVRRCPARAGPSTLRNFIQIATARSQPWRGLVATARGAALEFVKGTPKRSLPKTAAMVPPPRRGLLRSLKPLGRRFCSGRSGGWGASPTSGACFVLLRARPACNAAGAPITEKWNSWKLGCYFYQFSETKFSIRGASRKRRNSVDKAVSVPAGACGESPPSRGPPRTGEPRS